MLRSVGKACVKQTNRHLTLHNSIRCMGFTLGDKRSLPAVYNSFVTQIYITVLKKIKRAPRFSQCAQWR